MCIYWYTFHSCGHTTPDLQKTTLSHCHLFDACLRNWHEQRKYCTLEVDTPGSTLAQPRTCPQVWTFAQHERTEETATQVARDNALIRLMGTFAAKEAQLTELSDEASHIYNAVKRGTRSRAQAIIASLSSRPHKGPSWRNSDPDGGLQPQRVQTPHPGNQETLEYPQVYRVQFHRLAAFQDRENPSTNVIVQKSNIGCGRRTDSACLAGHSEPGMLLCPWLMARRLALGGGGDEEFKILSDNINRGGADFGLGDPRMAQIIRCAIQVPGLEPATTAAVDEEAGSKTVSPFEPSTDIEDMHPDEAKLHACAMKARRESKSHSDSVLHVKVKLPKASTLPQHTRYPLDSPIEATDEAQVDRRSSVDTVSPSEKSRPQSRSADLEIASIAKSEPLQHPSDTTPQETLNGCPVLCHTYGQLSTGMIPEAVYEAINKCLPPGPYCSGDEGNPDASEGASQALPAIRDEAQDLVEGWVEDRRTGTYVHAMVLTYSSRQTTSTYNQDFAGLEHQHTSSTTEQTAEEKRASGSAALAHELQGLQIRASEVSNGGGTEKAQIVSQPEQIDAQATTSYPAYQETGHEGPPHYDTDIRPRVYPLTTTSHRLDGYTNLASSIVTPMITIPEDKQLGSVPMCREEQLQPIPVFDHGNAEAFTNQHNHFMPSMSHPMYLPSQPPPSTYVRTTHGWGYNLAPYYPASVLQNQHNYSNTEGSWQSVYPPTAPYPPMTYPVAAGPGSGTFNPAPVPYYGYPESHHLSYGGSSMPLMPPGPSQPPPYGYPGYPVSYDQTTVQVPYSTAHGGGPTAPTNMYGGVIVGGQEGFGHGHGGGGGQNIRGGFSGSYY